MRNLLLFSAILAAGCATPQPPPPEPAASTGRPREIIPAADADGMMLIDWNGLRLEDLFAAFAQSAGKIVVYDRREVATKPPVNLSRAIRVPASGIYPLTETVASENGLWLAPCDFALSPTLAAHVIRIVPREEATKHGAAFEFTPPDYFAAKDMEFLVVIGGEPTAGLVRTRIAGLAEAWALQSATTAEYAAAWAKRRSGDTVPPGSSLRHLRIRDGEPSWLDLFRFASPFPARPTSFSGSYFGLGRLVDEDGDSIPDIRIPESARGLDACGGLFRGATRVDPPISPTPAAPAR